MTCVVGQVVRYRGRLATVTGYSTGGRLVLVPEVVTDAWRISEWRWRHPWIDAGAFSIDESELECDDD